VTSTIVSALSLTLALAGLVYLHQRDLHRQRQARRRYSHQLIQAQLDRARTYDLRRDLDDEYRRLRENAGDAPLTRPWTRAFPYDWERDERARLATTPYDWETDALAAALNRLHDTREEVTT
jgi:hypothetical protein